MGDLAEDVWLCSDSRWSINEDSYVLVSFGRGDGASIIVDLHDDRYLMFHAEAP